MKRVDTEDNLVMTRYQTMASKLKEKRLDKCGSTEKEIMESLGFMRVYDAGNLRLIWTRDKV